MCIQLTPNNSNLQGKSEKKFELSGVQVIGSLKKTAGSKLKDKTVFTVQ